MASTPAPEGCLVLGVTGSVDKVDDIGLQKNDRPIYVTRHRIDSYRQSKDMSREVASEMFVPCIGRDDSRPVGIVWYLIRSELVHFALHMSTLFFGVVKEAMDMRHDDALKQAHLIHSLLELIATLLIIVLKMANARMGCINVQLSIQRLQLYDPVYDPNLRAIWTWMWLVVVAGAFKFVLCVVVFVVCHEISHLGWTVLSNQVCIITMKLLQQFYEDRVQAAVCTITGDQQKVVIQEALMLLEETSAAEAGDDKHLPSSSIATFRRFISAAFNTKSLAKPPQIVMARDSQAQKTAI